MGRDMHALVVATALTAGGCAQIFGFDETEPYPDNGIRLSFVKKRVGATVVEEAMDLAAGTATFLVPDAAEPSGLRSVPGALEDPDTWFGDIPAGTSAEILFTIGEDSVWRLYNYPALRSIQAVYGQLGHPDPEPAPANAQLDLAVTLDVPYAGEALWVYAVGAWAYRGFGEVPAAGQTAWDPPAVPYSGFASATGRPLERIRSGDAVAVLRYVGPTLAGYAAAPPFDQQDGVDAITATMATVAADRTLDVTFPTTIAGPRFSATTPAVAGLAQSWGVNAAPGTAIASNTGPSLLSGGLAETDTGVVSVPYGNPFPWDVVVTFSTSESRTYTPTGATNPTTLSAGLYTVDAPSAGRVFDLPQGLPLLVTIAGRALTTDGTVLALDRGHAVEISFVTDREACDSYGLTLYELVDNGAGTFVHTVRGGMSSTTPTFLVPGDRFAAGVPYTLRATCALGGTPNAATGDFVTRQWPLNIGYLDSGVFEVSP